MIVKTNCNAHNSSVFSDYYTSKKKLKLSANRIRTNRGNARRILIYLIGSLGDTVVSIPSLRALKKYFGQNAEFTLLHDLQIDRYITPEKVLYHQDLIHKYIVYVYSKKMNRYSIAFNLWLKLLRHRFHEVIYLAPSEVTKKRVLRDYIFFKLSGIRYLRGFSAIPPSHLYPRDEHGRPQPVKSEMIRKLKRLSRFGITHDDDDIKVPWINTDTASEQVSRWLSQFRRTPGHALIAVAPMSKQSTSQWPIEKFIQLSKQLNREKRIEIVYVGGAHEKDCCQRIINESGGGLNAAGEFTVVESAALLSKCKLAIVVDSGPMHLAAAVGTPCIVIQGGKDHAGQWSPFGEQHIVLRHHVPCEACRLYKCIVSGHPCIMKIYPNAVLEAVKNKLSELA
jgi:heptosyltransferase III